MQKQQLPLLLLPPNITSILYVTKSVQNPRIKKKNYFLRNMNLYTHTISSTFLSFLFLPMKKIAWDGTDVQIGVWELFFL